MLEEGPVIDKLVDGAKKKDKVCFLSAVSCSDCAMCLIDALSPVWAVLFVVYSRLV